MPTFNWQSDTKSLGERIGAMFKAGAFADITLNLGEDACKKSFKVHKNILAASSTIFEQMFFGPMSQTSDEDKTSVDIIDIHPDTFEKLLCYVYTDQLELEDVQGAILLHKASNKYMLDDLENQCLVYLLEKTAPDSALNVLEYALFIDNNQLKSCCLDHIATKAETILNSQDFLDINIPTLKLLLSDCQLVCPEVTILNAVLTYAEANCGITGVDYEDKVKAAKDYLIANEVFKCIKICALTPDDFVNGISKPDFFTWKERFQILSYIDQCSSELPPFLNAEQLADDEPHESPYKTLFRALRATLVTPKNFPTAPFECNLLITTTTNAIIEQISCNSEQYSSNKFKTTIEIVGHRSHRSAEVLSKGHLFSEIVQGRVMFEAGIPHIWHMKFDYCPSFAKDNKMCYEFNERKVKCFGRDATPEIITECKQRKGKCFGRDATAEAITVETSGWFPGALEFRFCSVKDEIFDVKLAAKLSDPNVKEKELTVRYAYKEYDV